MGNLNDDCEASKPQSDTNALTKKSEIEETTSETMEANAEEAIVVSNNDNEEEMEKEENNEEENVKEVENDVNMIEEKSGGKVDGNSTKKKKGKKMKRRGKKVASMDASAKAVTEADKIESPKKKRVESSGMIFMCSSKTKKDCYRYKVLGLPAGKKDVVQKIYKGMRLFLFDCDLKLMYGIYKAAGSGGYNIEPKAFKSAFPSQVRFSVLDDCLPLAEEKFKKVIKDNYYKKNKFSCELNSLQVKNLCKLFRAANKGPKSKALGRSGRGEASTGSDRRRRRAQQGREDERRPVLHGDRLYKEHPARYERDVYASPRASRPLHAPLPLLPAAALPPPSYAYRRPLDVDVYRREPLPGGYDQPYLDMEMRHRDDIEYRDPYSRYREPPSHDLKYSTGWSSAHHPPAGLRPEYYTPAGRPGERHPPAGLRPEYYPPAVPPTERHAPAGPRAEYYPATGGQPSDQRPLPEYYTLADSSADYHSAGRQPEYLLRSAYR